MSRSSSKQKIEVLQGWVSWVSKQKGYPKTKVKEKLEN
jgi:hypothetical protein